MKKQPPIYSFVSKTQKWPKGNVRWKAATQALTKYLIKERRPANMVECQGFKEFIKIICPEYDVPTKQTITNNMEKIYSVEKEKLIEELEKQEFVAITSDGGTATNAASF